MIELGRAVLLICLGAADYSLIVGVFAVSTRRRLATSAENALVCSFVAAAIPDAREQRREGSQRCSGGDDARLA